MCSVCVVSDGSLLLLVSAFLGVLLLVVSLDLAVYVCVERKSNKAFWG